MAVAPAADRGCKVGALALALVLPVAVAPAADRGCKVGALALALVLPVADLAVVPVGSALSCRHG